VLEETQSPESIQREEYQKKLARAKDSISQYITLYLSKDKIYNPYDYSELYEIKPKEIQEYENLVANGISDSIIAQKKAYIKANKIYTTYELGHIFSLSKGDTTTVTEHIFYFYPNFKIKDLNVNYSLELSKMELLNYERFIFRKPLFDSFDYSQNQRNDNKYYNEFHKELNQRSDKNSFLKHIILLTSIAYGQEYLEPRYTCKMLAQQQLKKTITDVEIIKTPTDGLASEKNYHYQFRYETSDGVYQIAFNEFLEIVEISPK
jgi:hypothetical protein